MGRFGRLFGRFNLLFDRTTGLYQGVVGRLLSAPLRWLAVFAAMLVIALFIFTRIPGGFLPIEDQGTVLTAVQAPRVPLGRGPKRPLRRSRPSIGIRRLSTTHSSFAASAFLGRGRPMR